MSDRRSGRTTHVLKYNGGTFSIELGPRTDINTFREPLSRFNGTKPWALTLVPIPETMNYDEMLEKRIEPTRFLQAGGYADRMTVEIRRAGGDEWNLDCIWGVLGHQADGEQQLDVPIKLPASTQLVSSSEVFKAEEAAELFYTYFKTGDIPDNYALRPIGGWTAEGEWVNLSRRPAS